MNPTGEGTNKMVGVDKWNYALVRLARDGNTMRVPEMIDYHFGYVNKRNVVTVWASKKVSIHFPT